MKRFVWAGALLWSAAAFAATTTTWEIDGYQDFLRGRMEGLSVTHDGQLIPGPKIDTVFSSDQPEIWSAARASDGSIYLGTGHRGRVYKIDAAGKSSLLWTADQPEIFAIAVDARGVVYAAPSPDSKVYRIENGKATEYFAPGEHYIWALAVAADGTLYVATGDQGKIYRVTPAGNGAGKGELYYETGQAHVTSLAFDREGRLLAGSEPNGILYRVTAQNKAFVLYDSALPEIRAMVAAPDGSVYAAALGGSVARRVGATQNLTVTPGGAVVAPATSITVTDTQAGLSVNPTPQAKPAAAAQAAPVVSPVTITDSSGTDKSALYKINSDNTVETLWTSKEENVYDVAVSARGEVMFVTDAQGRVYRLDPDRKATLVSQTNEGEAMRILSSPTGALVATANLGKLLRLDPGTAPAGWYESPVHDSNTVARWGHLMWEGAGTGVAFRTRAGNSARPDTTWSDWSEPITDPSKSAITSPNARYIQWRAEFKAGATPAPSLDNVTIAYLPQNTPPVVHSISVTSAAKSNTSATATTGSAVGSAYSITVTDTDTSASAGASSQTLSRAVGQQIQIAWQADDPDGDKLNYTLYFRGQDEREWKMLRANMAETTYLLDGDVFADGRYYFRVVASDRPSNPAGAAREAEYISAPMLIDNTPPTVNVAQARRTGSAVEINVDAEDKGSPLHRCEYSIDAGPWLPVEAADGVTDSQRERFDIHIDAFPAGEHLVVIRAYDAAGNAGLAKTVIR